MIKTTVIPPKTQPRITIGGGACAPAVRIHLQKSVKRA